MGEAETVDEAVEVIRRTLPDVVLLDVHMPDGDGRLRALLGDEQPPATRLLAVSVLDACASPDVPATAG